GMEGGPHVARDPFPDTAGGGGAPPLSPPRRSGYTAASHGSAPCKRTADRWKTSLHRPCNSPAAPRIQSKTERTALPSLLHFHCYGFPRQNTPDIPRSRA